MFPRFGPAISVTSLVLAVLVVIAWGISYFRVDGVAASRNREYPTRPTRESFLPPGEASEAEKAAAEEAYHEAMVPALQRESAAILENMRFSGGVGIQQRNGRIALTQQGPITGWPDSPPWKLRLRSRAVGEKSMLDDFAFPWWYAGFGYGSVPGQIIHRAVTVPHWFLIVLLLAYPGWRWRQKRLQRRQGFEVVNSDTPGAGLVPR